jgi:hypothetical protein
MIAMAAEGDRLTGEPTSLNGAPSETSGATRVKNRFFEIYSFLKNDVTSIDFGVIRTKRTQNKPIIAIINIHIRMKKNAIASAVKLLQICLIA